MADPALVFLYMEITMAAATKGGHGIADLDEISFLTMIPDYAQILIVIISITYGKIWLACFPKPVFIAFNPATQSTTMS